MTSRWRFITPLVTLVLVLAACSSNNSGSSASASAMASGSGGGGGSDISGQTVTVIGTWSGTEQTNFLAMVKPWEDQTGATVKYPGTRAINTSSPPALRRACSRTSPACPARAR